MDDDDTPGASPESEGNNKSVLKAASLLRVLADQPRTGATSSELARASGLARPTAFRLLSSLEQAGLVDRVGNNYVLGWELIRIGRLADPYEGLTDRAQPLLQKLADTVNELVTLQVVNGRSGLDFVADAEGSHLVNVRSQRAGASRSHQWPLHATAAGKVFLAQLPTERVAALLPDELPALASRTITDRNSLLYELERVRTQGYGLVDSELEEELAAVAQPIFDSNGTFVATVTVSGPRYRFGLSRLHEVLEQMNETRDALVATCWPDRLTD